MLPSGLPPGPCQDVPSWTPGSCGALSLTHHFVGGNPSPNSHVFNKRRGYSYTMYE